MIHPTMSLRQILNDVRQGDQVASQALMETFYPKVRQMVHQQLQQDFRKHHRWILPLFSTGDIVQDVFVAVVKGLDGFQGEDETALLQYLSAMVKHRLLDALRYHEAARRDVRKRVPEPTQGMAAVAPAMRDATPSLAASLGEQWGIYLEVLQELPEKQQRLIQMRLQDEEPFAEIAEKLGHASADAARKAFQSAQARLLVRLRARGLHTGDGA